MKIVIATVKRPKAQPEFEALCAQLRHTAKEHDLIVLPGIWWTSGNNCFNLAMEIRGDDDKAKLFADAITMHLMPARWTETGGRLPRMDTIDVLPESKPVTSEDLRKLAAAMRDMCPLCGAEGEEDHAQGCPRYRAESER